MFTLINKKGENMKKRRLRKWVIPTLSTLIVVGLVSVYSITNKDNTSYEGKYVTNTLIENVEPVNEVNDTTIERPYKNEGVTISKNFYSKDDAKELQETSLIFYENIYIQSKGTLYSSDNEFDITSIADGVVKQIKEDKLLGNIIEVEYGNVVALYQSVDNITVKENETVTKGQIIASSGNNSLSNEKDNCLYMEMYVNGTLTNPESIYGIDLNIFN